MCNYMYDQILHCYICSVLFVPISCTLLWHYRGVFCAEEESSTILRKATITISRNVEVGLRALISLHGVAKWHSRSSQRASRQLKETTTTTATRTSTNKRFNELNNSQAVQVRYKSLFIALPSSAIQ